MGPPHRSTHLPRCRGGLPSPPQVDYILSTECGEVRMQHMREDEQGRDGHRIVDGRRVAEVDKSDEAIRIPFADLQRGLPAGMTALYGEIQEGQALIPGLQMGIGALIV